MKQTWAQQLSLQVCKSSSNASTSLGCKVMAVAVSRCLNCKIFHRLLSQPDACGTKVAPWGRGGPFATSC